MGYRSLPIGKFPLTKGNEIILDRRLPTMAFGGPAAGRTMETEKKGLS